jgi:hypothetical protein
MKSEPDRGGTKLGMTVRGELSKRDFEMRPGRRAGNECPSGGVADVRASGRDVILQINKCQFGTLKNCDIVPN